MFDLLELVSFDKLYFFGEYDNDWPRSGSSGTFAFPFPSRKSVGSAGEFVGSVSGAGSSDFAPIEIEAIGDVVPLVMFVPRGVQSKGGQLIGIESKGSPLIEPFWRPKY